MYAHMESINVSVGQKVKRGQKIGTVGETGRATAPHVHYEVLVRGQRVNPIQFCLEGISSTEYKELVEMSQNANISYD
jgi:murein DD-endopeptidase MepM/ murein hydrolase activator NlpD